MTGPAHVAVDVTADVRAAYDATGAAWDNGPRRIYDQLAIVAPRPIPRFVQRLDRG